MPRRRPIPNLDPRAKTTIEDLIEAIEVSDLHMEIEAGCEGDGPYARACAAVGRKKKRGYSAPL